MKKSAPIILFLILSIVSGIFALPGDSPFEDPMKNPEDKAKYVFSRIEAIRINAAGNHFVKLMDDEAFKIITNSENMNISKATKSDGFIVLPDSGNKEDMLLMLTAAIRNNWVVKFHLSGDSIISDYNVIEYFVTPVRFIY